MNSWEKECNKIEEKDIDETEQFRLQKQMLTDIFSEYCTERKRQNGRLTLYRMGRKAHLSMTQKKRE